MEVQALEITQLTSAAKMGMQQPSTQIPHVCHRHLELDNGCLA